MEKVVRKMRTQKRTMMLYNNYLENYRSVYTMENFLVYANVKHELNVKCQDSDQS